MTDFINSQNTNISNTLPNTSLTPNIPVQPVTPTFAPLPPQNNGPKKGLVAGVTVGVVALLSAITYFAFTTIVSPAKIKEQVVLTQEVLTNYNRSLTDIMSSLVEDDPETSAGMERSLEKSTSLLNEVEKHQKSMDDLLVKITASQLEKYRTSLEEYIKLANEIIFVQKDYVAISEGYIKPFKAYEELNLAVAGVSNYMYSDPTKYVSELDKFITEHEKIYQDLKKIEPKGWFVEGHEAMLKSIDINTKLLKEMKEAVGKRSQQDIIAATKKFEDRKSVV